MKIHHKKKKQKKAEQVTVGRKERITVNDEKQEINTAEQDAAKNGGDAAEKATPDAAGETGKKPEESGSAGEKQTGGNEKESRTERALKSENEKLKRELEESDDKYRRMIAEYDNYRKRTAKERDGIYADAYADALKELLSVKDALELAVRYSESDKVVEGVRMTLAKFTDTFQKLGVEEFGKENEPFDPNIHNAVMHVEDEALGENVIAEVLMKGYRKGDRILRHAMVKVAN